MADVKIPKALYDMLIGYHLCGDHSNEQQIVSLLEEKEQARRKRQYYQAMQDTSLPEEIRQIAKEEYWEIVGVPPKFRY